MKRWRILYRMIALVMILSIISPEVFLTGRTATVQAAVIKISKTSLKLEVGKSATLKLIGTVKKPTWSTSDKTVATVSKTGKVTAVNAGTARITAKLGKSKYACKVTVKAAAKPKDTNTAFDVQEATFGKITTSIPKDWIYSIVAQQDEGINVLLYPASANVNAGTSNVSLAITQTDEKAADYDELKKTYTEIYSKGYFEEQLSSLGLDIELKNLEYSDFDSKLGKVFKVSYSFEYQNVKFKGLNYVLCIDNYLLQFILTDIGDNVEPSLTDVAETMINSVQVEK